MSEADNDNIFQVFELLMLQRFSTEPVLWNEWKIKLRCHDSEPTKRHSFPDDEIREIPQSLWFLSVALHKRLEHLLQLVRWQDQKLVPPSYFRTSDSLLSQYINLHHFTEFHLDSIFKYGEDTKLPRELFKCTNIKHLSLKYNGLDRLPADIGRMASLQHLALTNNKLQVPSIPYTLTFCKNLRTLLLDNNLLDALPGFLLKMTSLLTVHRHGNHNYFKSTFMWYHTDVNFRIIPTSGANDVVIAITPNSLQFWAAKAVIGEKSDFFCNALVAPFLQDYISRVYDSFNICDYCNKACLIHDSGYKVITFKNPYLGNTCVPFQHWACSVDCAKALEVPARLEQIAAARYLDKQYDEFVNTCQLEFERSTSHVFFGSGSKPGTHSQYHSRSACGCCVM